MLAAFQIKHLLNSQGQTATLTTVTTGTYSPSTGVSTGASQGTYPIKAYFASYSLTETDRVVSGSRSVLVGPTDTAGNTLPEPVAGDKLEGVMGDVVVISSVQKIFSGDSVVCYICESEE